MTFFLFGYLLSYINNRYNLHTLSDICQKCHLLKLTSAFRKKQCFTSLFAILLCVMIAVLGLVIYKLTSIGFSYFLSFCILASLYICIPKSSNGLIKKISDNSYGLYLFHSPLIYITATYLPNINPLLMVFINFFVFGGIAYAITGLLSNSALKFAVGK